MASKEKPKKEEKPAAPAPEGAEGEAAAKPKLAGKTLILFIVLPAILILGGGGAAAFFLLSKPKADVEHAEEAHGEEHGKEKGKKKDAHKKEDKHAKADSHGKEGEAPAVNIVEGDGVYYVKLPDLLVNVSTGNGQPAFLKLRLTIEAADQEVVDAIEPELPRVADQFQSFLRELRVDDISGSSGAYRMRLELLRRVNLAIAPAKANAVLIEEMLVQ